MYNTMTRKGTYKYNHYLLIFKWYEIFLKKRPIKRNQKNLKNGFVLITKQKQQMQRSYLCEMNHITKYLLLINIHKTEWWALYIISLYLSKVSSFSTFNHKIGTLPRSQLQLSVLTAHTFVINLLKQNRTASLTEL